MGVQLQVGVGQPEHPPDADGHQDQADKQENGADDVEHDRDHPNGPPEPR